MRYRLIHTLSYCLFSRRMSQPSFLWLDLEAHDHRTDITHT